MVVQFADYTERFTTLDAKGSSPKGLATLRVMGALTTPDTAAKARERETDAQITELEKKKGAR